MDNTIKYYWVHLQTEARNQVFHTTTVINDHPFVFEKDMNDMSKKTADDANQIQSPFMKARKYPSVHYLVNWKEITKEEYELHRGLHKKEEHEQ